MLCYWVWSIVTMTIIVRVSESMCIGEGYNNDDPLGEERCETRATGEGTSI